MKPEQVEKVHIRSLARAADILADQSKYDPRSKETADHSLPYAVAAALVDRQVTPAEFTPEKIADATIRAQLRKVEVVADAEIEKVFPTLQRTIVTIHTTDGRKLTRQLDFPKGDPRNPLSDREVEEKFQALAEPVLTPAARRRVVDAVWKLDELASAGAFLDLLKADV